MQGLKCKYRKVQGPNCKTIWTYMQILNILGVNLQKCSISMFNELFLLRKTFHLGFYSISGFCLDLGVWLDLGVLA